MTRTVQDLGRLIPFSVFVIVPFAELLLPVALKLFPNLLPSTYEGQSAKDVKAKNLRATRKEVSSFLRQTMKETGLPVSADNAQREEFAEFFRKVVILLLSSWLSRADLTNNRSALPESRQLRLMLLKSARYSKTI